MFGRKLLYGLVFAGCVGLPYLSSQWSKASKSISDFTSSSAAADPASSLSTNTAPLLASVSKPTAAEPPLVGLAEAIRFDIAASWLFTRWPRVTAGLPDDQLQGYRVPLITGTTESDAAGALTYYFNPQQRLQKIHFKGAIGDPTQLVGYVVGRFGLTRQQSDDPGLHLYQTRWNGKPINELKLRPVRVVKSEASHARYDVELTLVNWGK